MHRILNLIAKLNITDSKAPEWVLLFAAGWGKLADGIEFLVDKTAFDLITAMIASRGNEIHWDYEHASIQDRGAIANGAPAAGWIRELAWDETKGILARVEWTEKAAGHIAAREYRYFSPVFAVQKKDKRVCYLDSVALTNRPKTNNLTPILAAIEAGMGIDKEEKMDLKQLIAALGLAADAAMEQIIAALAALGVEFPKAEPVIPESIAAALEIKENITESVVVASIHALKATASTGVSAADFKALKDKMAERDASDLVAAAMGEGKVSPAQKDWATEYAKKDPEGFKIYVAKAPVVVPLKDLPGKTDEPAGGRIEQATLDVGGLLGVSKEDLEKYGK